VSVRHQRTGATGMRDRLNRWAAWALAALMVVSASVTLAADPRLPAIDAVLETLVAKQEVAGVATAVVRHDGVLHLGGVGWADIASRRPMTADTLCWIASMTKPITGIAILMLEDEGRLHLDDPVEKYVPEFAALRTPAGHPARLTIRQLLNHTSGLGEAAGPAAREARTLADLVPVWLAAPMKYEPGAKWVYTQSGINLAARIVEVVGGKPFDAFLEERLFGPLGMTSTTFYPTDDERRGLATAYARPRGTDRLEPVPPRTGVGERGRPPQGNGGLFSTARDYARLCRMLLNRGSLDGRRYLSEAAVRTLSTANTGELPTGFFQSPQFGNRGLNYGWGVGTCVLREPHDGVAAMLSPGTFGHGGAWGTQAWIDPSRDVAYVLMLQRSDLPNSDASDARREFQQAAAAALP
jgi:CubicO group peptidase (beta-lactamase class C family)